MTILERDTINRFILAKCPCCAEKIMIAKDMERAFCSFCGKEFLTEAAVTYSTAKSLSAYRPNIQVTSSLEQSEHPMPHMMTIREVAETGVLSESFLRRLLKQNRLPAVYIGSKALINYDRLLEFLNSTSFDPENNE